MKLEVALIAAALSAALVAGPAAAQGTFSPGRNRPAASTPSPGYGLPSATPAPAYKGPTTSRIYSPPAAPKAEPFKPYEAYKPSSVYGPNARKKRN